jgi:hypothetical protein
LRDFISLSYVYYEPEKIEEGLRRLKKCMENSSV